MTFYRIIMASCFALLLASCAVTPKLYINTGDMTMSVTQSVQPVTQVKFSPTGQSVVSGGWDEIVRLWDLTGARMMMKFKGHTGMIISVFYLSDGKTIASKGRDNILRFWDMTTGKEVGKIASGPFLASLSQDGRFALDREKVFTSTLSLYDVRTGTIIQRFHGEWGILSPDGKFVLVGSYEKIPRLEGRLDLLESKTGATLWQQNNLHWGIGLNDAINMGAAFSSDGSRIIVAYNNPVDKKTSILFIDTATGKIINEFGHSSYDGVWEYTYNTISALAFSPDSRFIMSGYFNAKYKLWDPSTGQMVREMKMGLHRPTMGMNIIPSVAFSPEGRTAVVTSLGAVRHFDIATGEEIAAMIAFEDGEWIVITTEGYYNASEKGAQYLNVEYEAKDYTVDQFYDVFYRPDIVAAKLSGQDIKGLVSLTMKDASKTPPPMIDIKPPKETNTPKVNVCYQVKSTGGGIGEVRLFHNGKLIQSDGYYRGVAKSAVEKTHLASLDSNAIYENMRSVSIKGKADALTVSSKSKGDIFEDCKDIDVVPGDNEVSVTAFNSSNTVQSYMKTINFNSKAKSEDPHLYILAVGIDQYKDTNVNLKYAVKDAKDIEEKLKVQSATLYKPENIHYSLLTDREATKANITNKINEISQVIKPNDSFILFVAGHGVLLQNQYYLLTHDYDGMVNDISMISSNEIVEISKKIKSLGQLFIFDTCHAGGVDYIVSGLYDARMSVLAKKMGLHIYASANDKQAAMDGYKGNGLFTYTLLDGLNNNKEADKNKDGKVSIVGLGEYSKKMTTNISKEIGHSQTPLIINFGKDSPVYKLQ